VTSIKQTTLNNFQRVPQYSPP